MKKKIRIRILIKEKGSAFFYILLAVALFGALAFTVARGMRGQQTTAMSERKAELAASDILNYGQEVMRAVDRVRRNGCSENEITFEGNGGFSKQKSGTPYDYTNPNSPADYSCHIFHPNGGNISPRLIDESYAIDPSLVSSGWMHPQSFVTVASRVLGNGSDSGAAGTDLIMWIGRLTNQVCMKINDKLGISNPSGAPPIETWDCASNIFQGSFSNCTNPIGDVITELDGKSAFCVAYDNSSTQNIFIQVLLAR